MRVEFGGQNRLMGAQPQAESKSLIDHSSGVRGVHREHITEISFSVFRWCVCGEFKLTD